MDAQGEGVDNFNLNEISPSFAAEEGRELMAIFWLLPSEDRKKVTAFAESLAAMRAAAGGPAKD